LEIRTLEPVTAARMPVWALLREVLPMTVPAPAVTSMPVTLS
jgi:hypothetical protein